MRKLLALPFAALFAFAACGGGKESAEGKEGPEQTAKNVLISESEKGASNWLLRAKEAQFFNEPVSYADLEHPHLIFNAQGMQDSEILSDKGRYDMEARLITLSGNVHGKSAKENAEIKTEKIYYDLNSKKIHTDAGFTLIRAGITVKGEGLRANPDFSEIEIIKQTTTLPKTAQGLGAAPPKAAAK